VLLVNGDKESKIKIPTGMVNQRLFNKKQLPTAIAIKALKSSNKVFLLLFNQQKPL
jgi:hypothetical protein